MDRINRILQHPLFIDCIRQNETAEKERCFCRHDIEHFCAVARIAMLINLEEKRSISKSLLYAAALLHDCGRFRQYRERIPHEEASAELAERILSDCGYEKDEIACIKAAILLHRNASGKDREGVLADIIYRADKMSRNCRFCNAYEACNWKEENKQQKLVW